MTAIVLDAPITDISGIRAAEAELARLKTVQEGLLDRNHPGSATPDTPRAINLLANQIGDLEKRIEDAQFRLSTKMKNEAANLVADLDAAVKTVQDFFMASSAIEKVVDRLKAEAHPLAEAAATALHGRKIIVAAGGVLANLSRELKAAQG